MPSRPLRPLPALFFAAALAPAASALTFEQWRAIVFDTAQLAEPATSGPTADPDADGHANLAEYFSHGDPLGADAELIATKIDVVANHLTLAYRETDGQTGVAPHLQTSRDLHRWITHNSLPEVDREAFTGFDSVTLADPSPLDTARRFLRLRLFQTPADLTLFAPTLPAIDLEAPTAWRIDWHDPNLAESGYAVEHFRIDTGHWHRLALLSADRNHWLHDPARFHESLTYRIVARSDAGIELLSDPVSLPDTDGDGIPDALEAGSSYAALPGAFASYFDQFDSDGDTMSDGYEARHGLNPLNAADAAEDSDGDGQTNAQEYAAGTDPKDYYNGQPAVLRFVSGHQQSPVAGEYYPEPIVVRVTKTNGAPWVNAPLVFRVRDDAPGGGVADSAISTVPAPTKTLRTDANGEARVFWKVVAP